MSRSILDRGLTSGGFRRLAYIVVTELDIPVAIGKPQLQRYHSRFDKTRANISIRSTLANHSSQIPTKVYNIHSRDLYLLLKTQTNMLAKNSIFPIFTVVKVNMPLPQREVIGSTIAFDVEVELLNFAGDALLVYVAENSSEEFMLSSLAGQGITLTAKTTSGATTTYKWKCRIAPEATADITIPNGQTEVTLQTYCRLFFGEDNVELERGKLTLIEGRPTTRPA